ncbi:hypothetical protein [Peribacillus frigoritolerans]|uniref:Uncharacterized protein n=1 Tax=Peribacillus castrilensis TaxID=2897690 RepID=A0AAW9NE95_9BACI|nr:hypothetical protein [Peribacillus castrilensis]
MKNESTKRCAAHAGLAAVRRYEMGNEAPFERDYIMLVVGFETGLRVGGPT